MKHVATTAQWIGEAACQGADAYYAGDYDTLKACLESIQAYAQDLGYVPGPPPPPVDTSELLAAVAAIRTITLVRKETPCP